VSESLGYLKVQKYCQKVEVSGQRAPTSQTTDGRLTTIAERNIVAFD